MQRKNLDILFPGSSWGAKHLFFDHIGADDSENGPTALTNCKFWSLSGKSFRTILAKESLLQQKYIV